MKLIWISKWGFQTLLFLKITRSYYVELWDPEAGMIQLCLPPLEKEQQNLWYRVRDGALDIQTPQAELNATIVVGLDIGWHTITSVISYANGTILYGPEVDTPAAFRELIPRSTKLENEIASFEYPNAWVEKLFPPTDAPHPPIVEPTRCHWPDHLAHGKEESIINTFREPLLHLKSLIDRQIHYAKIDSVINTYPTTRLTPLVNILLEEHLFYTFGHVAGDRHISRAEALVHAYGLRIGCSIKDYSCLASTVLSNKQLDDQAFELALQLCKEDKVRRWLVYIWYGVSGLELGFMEPQKRDDLYSDTGLKGFLRVVYTDVGGDALGLVCTIRTTPLVEGFLRVVVMERIRKFLEFCRDDETLLRKEYRVAIAIVIIGDLERANKEWLGLCFDCPCSKGFTRKWFRPDTPDGMLTHIWGEHKWSYSIDETIDFRYRSAWGAAVAFWSDVNSWQSGWEYSRTQCNSKHWLLPYSTNNWLSPWERERCDHYRHWGEFSEDNGETGCSVASGETVWTCEGMCADRSDCPGVDWDDVDSADFND